MLLSCNKVKHHQLCVEIYYDTGAGETTSCCSLDAALLLRHTFTASQTESSPTNFAAVTLQGTESHYTTHALIILQYDLLHHGRLKVF